MNGREKKNQFLVAVHEKEDGIQRQLRLFELEEENLASVVLQTVLRMEEKFYSYGMYAFYDTLTGSLLTDYFLELLSEEEEMFRQVPSDKGFFPILKFFWRKNGGYREYLEFCIFFHLVDFSSLSPLLVDLCSGYIALLEDAEEQEKGMSQLLNEFLVMGDEVLATAMMQDISALIKKPEELVEVQKILKKTF